jgi:hypothetical protein
MNHWIKIAQTPESIRDYIEAIVKLAAYENEIAVPEVVFFEPWIGTEKYPPWRENDENTLGFALVGQNLIALYYQRNLDVLAHIALHETRHLRTFARPEFNGAPGEQDACGYATDFERRRCREMMELLTRFKVRDDPYMGTRNHSCAGVALSAERALRGL